MIYMMPYKIGSKSARALAAELRCLQIKGHKRLGNSSTVINWGNKETHPINNRRMPVRMFNKPRAVASAADKISTFNLLHSHGVRTPDYTTNGNIAKEWASSGQLVYGRRYTNSSQGRGIVILSHDDPWVGGLPLYTKGILGGKEYRVHVAFGRVIDFTQKKKRNDTTCNEYIRNHENGWVFCREEVMIPPDVAYQSIRGIDALGLDFGALDVVVSRDGKAHILEINSAPGIEGTTLTKYKEAFLKELAR